MIRNVGRGGCYALYFMIVSADKKWYNQKNSAKEKIGVFKMILFIECIIACLLFVVVLLLMVYASGARNFINGFVNCYIIWFVVNWFDVFVLDMWILANWKKCRLPGTEYMDKEYKSNNRKSIIDGFFGMAIGLAVALVVGGLIEVLF